MSSSTDQSTPTWPERGVICIDCRTTYPAGTVRCQGGSKHTVADLRDPAGREALASEVWGPPSRRRQAREAARAGGAGAVGGGAAEGCGACEVGEAFSGCGEGSGGGGGGGAAGEIMVVLVVIGVAIIAGILIYFAVKWIVARYRRSKARIRPNGAMSRPPTAGDRSRRVGVIVDAATAIAPLTADNAVAFSIVARVKRFMRSDVMLRDSATIGFDVLLDTGERVRIPLGEVVIDMRDADDITDSTDAAHVNALLAHIADSPQMMEEMHPPVPWDRIDQQLLVPGMRVEVRGPMRLVPSASAHGGGYRDAAEAMFVPDGVSRLAVVRAK